ncbi:MAG TPA: 30S ribosomal protein S15 [Methanomassiliicoccales archaeon]|nr:30S ribosomal protein S15 [Methanomassiliicoccales archaeon]
MARMHARRRGSSRSRRPLITENPEWVPLSKDEVMEMVVKLGKEGMTSSKIGLVLRDQHAVPSVKLSTDKSVMEILHENDLSPKLPEDLMALMRKAINLNIHVQNGNRGDIANRRGLQLVESKIRRLVKYYKRLDILPKDWNYSLKKAELLIE